MFMVVASLCRCQARFNTSRVAAILRIKAQTDFQKKPTAVWAASPYETRNSVPITARIPFVISRHLLIFYTTVSGIFVTMGPIAYIGVQWSVPAFMTGSMRSELAPGLDPIRCGLLRRVPFGGRHRVPGRFRRSPLWKEGVEGAEPDD